MFSHQSTENFLVVVNLFCVVWNFGIFTRVNERAQEGCVDSSASGHVQYFVITATRRSLTQKADLTRMAQTLSHLDNVHWLLIENKYNSSEVVPRLLSRFPQGFTHLKVELLDSENDVGYWNAAYQCLRMSSSLKQLVPIYVIHFQEETVFDLTLFELISKQNMGRDLLLWPIDMYYKTVRVEMGDWNSVANSKVAVYWTNEQKDGLMHRSSFALSLSLILNHPSVYWQYCTDMPIELCLWRKLGVGTRDLRSYVLNQTRALAWATGTYETGSKGSSYGYLL